MERLTNTGTNGEIWITDNDETRKIGKKEAAYKKLKAYEDAEEQGRSLQLPYPLGTQFIYFVDDKDMAINALEKQIVKNVVGIHHSTNDEENSVYGEDARFGQCPSCGELISSVWNKEYCGDCGQKLDWSDEE